MAPRQLQVRPSLLSLLLHLLHQHQHTAAASAAGASALLVPVSDDGGSALEAALHRAGTAQQRGGGPAAVELAEGVHRLSRPVRIPSGVSLRGRGAATISGGIPIERWEPDPDTPWLFRAPLPSTGRGRGHAHAAEPLGATAVWPRSTEHSHGQAHRPQLTKQREQA